MAERLAVYGTESTKRRSIRCSMFDHINEKSAQKRNRSSYELCRLNLTSSKPFNERQVDISVRRKCLQYLFYFTVRK
eukprot:scaffold83555_cov18-Prasinocladus_malaysianus.AAC.1